MYAVSPFKISLNDAYKPDCGMLVPNLIVSPSIVTLSGLVVQSAVSIEAAPPSAMARQLVDAPMPLGVRVLDTLVPCGRGQRIGIFAGSGVGKSTLMSMITRGTSAELNVVALVGERGREVREFIEHDLGEEGLARSVVVIATSDAPPLVRLRAGAVATRIAEYYRDEGQDVLLMMDSVTRAAMAQREVGLSLHAGEIRIGPESQGRRKSGAAFSPGDCFSARGGTRTR